jgi:hypothetical protein
MKELAKRGLTPKWEDSLSAQQVSDSSASNTPAGFLRPAFYVPGQDDFVQGDSEITFITYSGDQSSWEGIVYVHTSYMDDTYSADFLTPSDDGTNWNEYNEVYYPPDGGDPSCDNRRVCPVSKATPEHNQKGRHKIIALANHNTMPTARGFLGWLKNWWNCSMNVCGWGFIICSGGTRYICRAAYCIGGLFACL